MLYYRGKRIIMLGEMMFVLGKNFYSRYKLMLNSVFLVSVTSVLFVYPFDSHFRFTLGVAVMSTSFLYFPQLTIIPTAIFSGVGIFVTRWAIDVFIGNNEVMFAAAQSVPAFCYYVFFGICCHYLRLRASVNQVMTVILKLSISDFFSNLLEITLRHDFMLGDSAVILPELMGVAFLRAILVVYGYYLLKRYRIFILAEEHLKRYTQLIMVFAGLKTELYYLKKSSQDIENVMERSYLLYQQLTVNQADTAEKASAGKEALKIARDIHEIEKDYYRVISGLEKILIPSGDERGMRLSEIFHIIEQNTTRFLSIGNKKMTIHFSQEDDFITDEHYNIVSLLNNLIINAIEACEPHGVIKVAESRQGENVVFCVQDNGQGIAAQDLDLIFNPGFSTKYSETTGKMSTGLGLAHVKTLINMMGGTIKVTSQPGIVTVFTIAFPYDNLTKVIEKKCGQENTCATD